MNCKTPQQNNNNKHRNAQKIPKIAIKKSKEKARNAKLLSKSTLTKIYRNYVCSVLQTLITGFISNA